MSANFQERLFSNFLDGTLANAVERIAHDVEDVVERSCLLEAAEKLRCGSRLYEALEGALKTIEGDGLTYPRKWDAALAKARGEVA